MINEFRGEMSISPSRANLYLLIPSQVGTELSRRQVSNGAEATAKVWENPVRENTTHYTVGYTCKVVLRSYLALGCEVTSSIIVPAEGWPYLYVWTICPCIYAYVI
jgi:hypothetical protein